MGRLQLRSVVSQRPDLKAEENIQEIEMPKEKSKLSLMTQSAGNFMAKPGMADAVSGAATMVGTTVDPEGSGMGPVLSNAGQGAAIGTAVFPGIGTAVGAAIGAGLGLIQADAKRKEIKRQAEAQAKSIMAQGMENAAKAVQKGMVTESFAAKRRLKL
jgi:hypothetical protein